MRSRVVTGALAMLALTIVALPAVLSAAWAADGTGRFAGSTISNPTNGSTVSSSSPGATIYFTYNAQPSESDPEGGRFIEKVTASFDSEVPAGCAVPAGTTQTPEHYGLPESPERHEVTIELSPEFECNGTYTLTAVATLNGSEVDAKTSTITSTFDVAVRPTGLTKAPSLSEDAGTVSLSWAAPAGLPPDFVGYRVERSAPGSDSFETVGSPTETSFSDELPAGGGEYRYRVLTVRSSPGEGGTITSDPAAAPDSVIVVKDTDGPTPTTSGGSVTAPSIGSRVTLPSVAEREATSPTQPRTTGTIDTGFDPALNYGEIPGFDDQAGGATVFANDDGFTPRGLLKPVAGGLVLAVWAMHLRYLSRRVAELD